MGEKRSYAGKGTSFEGVFDVKEIYALVKAFLKNRKYTFSETSHTEVLQESGKEIVITLEPYKKITDYTKLILEIGLTFSDIQDVKIKVSGRERKLQKGSVEMELTGVIETDWDKKYAKTPFLRFMHALLDKYIFKDEYGSWEKELEKDMEEFIAEVRAHLNLFSAK